MAVGMIFYRENHKETMTKRRLQKDTAGELIRGYFEGLIKQNKKYKEKAVLSLKNNNTAQEFSRKDK
jgi:hypothetical protein